jgi:hypothetical protein
VILWFYPPPIRRRSANDPALADANIVRVAYRKLVWNEAFVWQRIALYCAVPTWPIWALLQAAYYATKLGGRVRAESGKGRLRQLTEAIVLAWSDLIPPVNYYMFELYDPAQRARANAYLLRAETKGGAFFLLRPAKPQPGRRRPFRDKAEFAAECDAVGLRAAPVLARFIAGAQVAADGAAPLPKTDLFLKPIVGKGGRGAERWHYDGARWLRDDQSFDEAGLLAHLAARSRREALLLQPRLVNHPDLAEVNLGALSTCRLMTALDEQERSEVIGAVLRMPSRRDMAVDNFHAGGIAAKIDLDTGRLGVASDMGLKRSTRWHEVHPVSGGRIEGLTVPCWPAVKTLVTEAHARLGDRVVIGWDVAVLADGPIIVEANGLPDPDTLQRPMRAPLGDTRLGALLAYHISQGTKWRKPEGRRRLRWF